MDLDILCIFLEIRSFYSCVFKFCLYMVVVTILKFWWFK